MNCREIEFPIAMRIEKRHHGIYREPNDGTSTPGQSGACGAISPGTQIAAPARILSARISTLIDRDIGSPSAQIVLRSRAQIRGGAAVKLARRSRCAWPPL
jgi:hypothetical protein